MISIKKLLKEGKMYMSHEEIQAIQAGQLRVYLSQFSKDETESNASFADQDKEYNAMDAKSPQSPVLDEIEDPVYPNISPDNNRGLKPQKFISVGLNGE